MLGRIREAASDVAETLRRLFQAPAVHGGATGLPGLCTHGHAVLEARVTDREWALRAAERTVDLTVQGAPCRPDLLEGARVRREEGWSAWMRETKACAMPVFPRGQQTRVELPPLPRRAAPRRIEAGSFRVRTRAHRDPIRSPLPRRAGLGFACPVVRQDLPLALSLPVAVNGEDPKGLPRAQAMRFSLAFVRQTGENIRNLEFLGIYRIPKEGVVELRHDARGGRLLLVLGPEAARAPRAAFMLARRKDDRSLVSCFLEEV